MTEVLQHATDTKKVMDLTVAEIRRLAAYFLADPSGRQDEALEVLAAINDADLPARYPEALAGESLADAFASEMSPEKKRALVQLEQALALAALAVPKAI